VDYLEYAYNVAQMSRQHENSAGTGPSVVEKGQTSQAVVILIFIVVPFMVGAAFLFFAIRFLLRHWRTMRPLTLQEDDPLAQSEEGITNEAQHEEIK
jgi:hypothetical protein